MLAGAAFMDRELVFETYSSSANAEVGLGQQGIHTLLPPPTLFVFEAYSSSVNVEVG